jgi:hypothetical protein
MVGMSFPVGWRQLRHRWNYLFGSESEVSRAEPQSALVLLPILLLAAAGFVWSEAYCSHNADSILPALISWQKLTWFFWTQNRFGNVLPLLTIWIRDIGSNFTAQVFLRAAMAMSIPWLVLLYLGNLRWLVLKYVLALALVFVSMQGVLAPIWLEHTPYGTSVFFFSCSLALHRINQYTRLSDFILTVVTLICLICSFFINSSLIIFAFPLWFGYVFLYPNKRNWWFLLLLMLAFGVCTLHSALTPGDNYFKWHISWNNFVIVASGLFFDLSWKLYVAQLCIICVSICVLQCVRNKGKNDALISPIVAKSLVMLISVAVYLITVTNLEWTRINDFSSRYFLLMFAIIPALCVVLTVEALEALIPKLSMQVRLAVTGAAVIVFGGVLLRQIDSLNWGCPDVERPRRENIRILSQLADRYGASFIAGDYWTVWPAVFDTLKYRQASGEQQPIVFGLSGRGEVLSAEVADYLNHADRVIVICFEQEVTSCYDWLLRINNGDWPKFSAVLEQGKLPQEHGSYFVLALDRRPIFEGTAAKSLPEYQNQLLFDHLRTRNGAQRKEASILLRAGEKIELGVFGPYAQMAPGNYQVRFLVKNRPPDPERDWFKIDVINARQTFYQGIFQARDLVTLPSGDWAVANFNLPHSLSSVNAIEFRVWTMGVSDLVLGGIALENQPPK